MPRMTSAEFAAFQARTAKPILCSSSVSKGVEKESELHDEIKTECARRGWYPIHSPMHRPTSFDMPKGTTVLDFCIAANDGIMIFAECKKKGEKPTEEQRNTIAWLRKLKHRADCVWSFEEFLKMLEGVK